MGVWVSITAFVEVDHRDGESFGRRFRHVS